MEQDNLILEDSIGLLMICIAITASDTRNSPTGLRGNDLATRWAIYQADLGRHCNQDGA